MVNYSVDIVVYDEYDSDLEIDQICYNVSAKDTEEAREKALELASTDYLNSSFYAWEIVESIKS